MKTTKPFFWHVFPYFFFICSFICLIFFLYTHWEFKRFYRNTTIEELKNRAVLFTLRISSISDFSPKIIDSLSQVSGKLTNTRFTIILPNGIVIGDTEEDPKFMEDHGTRPEVKMAFQKKTGVSFRYSTTLSREFVYVAVPALRNESVELVVRASIPLVTLTESISRFSFKLIFFAIFIISACILISYWISRKLSSTFIQIKIIADTFARGDLKPFEIKANRIEETEILLRSMNAMAQQLNERILIISQQKNEQNVILSAMVEGVIAINMNEQIMLINRAASAMLAVDLHASKGKSIQEVIRNTVFQKFVQELIQNKTTLKKEIVCSTLVERTIEIQGTIISDTKKTVETGVLLVLHDVTHLKHLENIRKDFVSNVSHELRTPLTSIQGFVETLLNGAMNKPDDLKRFLFIIKKQVHRLSAIIEDLLALSRLEKDETTNELHLERLEIVDILQHAVDVCLELAQKKDITITYDKNSSFTALLDTSLFEQAIINLIDNGIKYSKEHTTINIDIKRISQSIKISIKDQGCGINRKHHSRIFERFYRVDKDRSNYVGGTGLGLSIVKHIVSLHKGSISVDSTIGMGSTFTITLPDW